MKLCPVCHKNEALKSKILGIKPCMECQQRRSAFTLPIQPVEMIGASIKGERTEFAASIVQPRNSKGELSLEYLKAHGTKGIKTTPKEVKNARNIWDQAISPNLDISKTK